MLVRSFHECASIARTAFACAFVGSLAGCASTPYSYSSFEGAPHGKPISIEHGVPSKKLDRIGWVVGLPSRIVPLNRKVNNHNVSPETLAKLSDYLEHNDLADVPIFVNCYDPKGQWRRLRENKSVGAGWRYSLGTLGWLGYTILPNRVFGGDKYDPYTNTMQLSSDVPVVVIREAALAKDVHSRINPGGYFFVSGLPGFAIYRHARITGEVLSYARMQNDWDMEREAYRVLYPQFASQVATIGAPLSGGVWWAGPALGLSGAAVGHVAGRVVARHVGKERDVAAATANSPANAKPEPVIAQNGDASRVMPASAVEPIPTGAPSTSGP